MELTACRCELPAEIAARLDIQEDGGPVEYHLLYCAAGHTTLVKNEEAAAAQPRIQPDAEPSPAERPS